MAMFRPAPGLRERSFKSSEFSVERNQTSASAVPPPRGRPQVEICQVVDERVISVTDSMKFGVSSSLLIPPRFSARRLQYAAGRRGYQEASSP